MPWREQARLQAANHQQELAEPEDGNRVPDQREEGVQVVGQGVRLSRRHHAHDDAEHGRRRRGRPDQQQGRRNPFQDQE